MIKSYLFSFAGTCEWRVLLVDGMLRGHERANVGVCPKIAGGHCVAMDEKWVPAVMPQWRLPQWHQWRQDQTAWDQAGDMYWGNVIMKPAEPKHWLAGVYQVVFWCGTAQQGYGARRRQEQNMKDRQEV